MQGTMIFNSRTVVTRGLLAAIGYLLSPFSWWNDLYINLPIAYGMAWLAGLIDQRAFAFVLVISYWITNIAGLIMLHKGLTPGVADGMRKTQGYRKKIAADIAISAVYTGVIILLLHFRLLKLPWEYFVHTGR